MSDATRIAASILSVGAVALTVSGCTTFGTATPAPPSTLALYADDAGTAGEALDSGETLHAYNSGMSSAMLLDESNSTASSAGSAGFSIRETGTGDVIVTVDGVETTFTAADNTGWGFEQNGAGPGDPNYSLASWSAPDVGDALATDKHHQIWRYWWYPGSGGASTVGFAAVGTETTAPTIAGRTATATYEGYAAAMVSRTDDPAGQVTMLGNDLTMSANFDTARISGTIADLVVDPDGSNQSISGGEIALAETDIVGNGFNGQITVNNEVVTYFGGTAIPDVPIGNYGGKFFGPNGEEIAGVLSMALDDYVAAGFLSAEEVP